MMSAPLAPNARVRVTEAARRRRPTARFDLVNASRRLRTGDSRDCATSSPNKNSQTPKQMRRPKEILRNTGGLPKASAGEQPRASTGEEKAAGETQPGNLQMYATGDKPGSELRCRVRVIKVRRSRLFQLSYTIQNCLHRTRAMASSTGYLHRYERPIQQASGLRVPAHTDAHKLRKHLHSFCRVGCGEVPALIGSAVDRIYQQRSPCQNVSLDFP